MPIQALPNNGTLKMQRQRQKPLKLSLTSSERKAARIDTWVRAHLARCRDAEQAKTTHLKALRKAHEAAQLKPEPCDKRSEILPRQSQRVRRIWVSGADALGDPKRHDV